MRTGCRGDSEYRGDQTDDDETRHGAVEGSETGTVDLQALT